jgi:hypothetical protein
MAWSLLSSWVKKVSFHINSVKKDGLYTYHDGYKHMASGLVCGFSCVVIICINSGCRVCNWNRGWCRYQSKCSAIKVVCGTDLDLDFRRSLGIVRTHRFAHFGLMSLSLYLLFSSLIDSFFCLFKFVSEFGSAIWLMRWNDINMNKVNMSVGLNFAMSPFPIIRCFKL